MSLPTELASCPPVPLNALRGVNEILSHACPLGGLYGVLAVRADAYVATQGFGGDSAAALLLENVYNRLRDSLRVTDVVAHGHPGVFFVLARNLRNNKDNKDELAIICERILRIGTKPYLIRNETIHCGFSIGAVSGVGGKSDLSELLCQASAAMYHAGSRGGGFAFFSPEMLQLEGGNHNSVLLPFTVLHDLIDISYVPQFSRDGGVWGVRAIVSVDTLSGDQLPIDYVLARRDEKGLSSEVGDRVLQRILFQARDWNSKEFPLPSIAVDISVGHLLHPGFATSVLSIAEASGVPPSSLTLLLTEAAVATNLESVSRTMATLSEAGVRFGLRGMKAHVHPQVPIGKLPFSEMHMSAASIFNVPSSLDSAWVVQSILSVTKRLGMVLVAEGVRSIEERNLLVEGGCAGVEGPLFSGQLNPHEMTALLHGLRRQEKETAH